MIAAEKIKKYLGSRSTPASAKEIAQYAKLNYHTVRRALSCDLANVVAKVDSIKCKIDKTLRTGYTLAM